MTPIRVQRKRSRGWKMPENTVYVGRPTKFGNPFRIMRGVGLLGPLAQVTRYRVWLEGHIDTSDMSRPHPDWIASLRGKNLACWCPLDQPCHADVLLEIANSTDRVTQREP